MPLSQGALGINNCWKQREETPGLAGGLHLTAVLGAAWRIVLWAALLSPSPTWPQSEQAIKEWTGGWTFNDLQITCSLTKCQEWKKKKKKENFPGKSIRQPHRGKPALFIFRASIQDRWPINRLTARLTVVPVLSITTPTCLALFANKWVIYFSGLVYRRN